LSFASSFCPGRSSSSFPRLRSEQGWASVPVEGVVALVGFVRKCASLVRSCFLSVLRDFFAAQLQGTRFLDFFCLSDFPAGCVCAGLIPRAFCCLHRSQEHDPVSSRMRTAQERVLVQASLTSVWLLHSLSPPGGIPSAFVFSSA
jgi:hypothetical protein